MSKKKGLKTFLGGAIIGAGIGMLFAPKKGSETRKELKIKLDEMLEKVKGLDKEEVKNNIENKIEEIKQGLKELDKETVLNAAKKKAKDLEKKAEELVEYAIKKGTPVLESAAASIKETTKKVAKEVVNKLEKEEK